MMKRHICALMVLLLVITGQSAAQARGGMVVAGQMVLCTGTGPVTVYVDNTGAPVQPVHHCPDCVVQLFHGADYAMPRPAILPMALAAYVSPSVQPVPALPMQTAAPRGPPFVL